MFGDLLGGFIDKNKIVKDYIIDCLTDLAQELQCNYKELCVVIRPKNEQMDFDFWLCRFGADGISKPLRSITLDEILGGKEEEKKEGEE